MRTYRRAVIALVAGLSGAVAIGLTAALASAGRDDRLASLEGTVWVANRGAHTIRGFDASTGEEIATVAMRSGSQPGDLAYARGKLYVAEEFGTPPAIAIVGLESGAVSKRIEFEPLTRPHHVHASRGGGLVAFGLYGTDDVAVVDTETDELIGRWDTNATGEIGRAHAGVFSPRGRILYVASDATHEIVALDPRTGENLWQLTVVGAHELAVTRDGRTAYVTRRTANRLCVIDLIVHDECKDVLALGLPDTLRLAKGGQHLTVGLRTSPAQVAVVDTRTFEFDLVRIGPVLETNTIAGHQWTSRNGHYTFAAYEGGTSPGVAVIDHHDGNRVVSTLSYPGRPHGVDRAPEPEDEG
jgi:DNA-binding beta-propeller fold protein YncE